MKSQFKTPYNLKDFPTPKGEINYQPSMTLPDQSMTIREILQRHQSGLPTTGQRVPFYQEEGTDGVTQQEFQRLDLAEQQQIIEQHKYELEQIKLRANQKAVELKQRQADAQAKKVQEARDEASKRRTAAEKQGQQSDQSTNIS